MKRLPIYLTGDDRRVIARPFILGASRVRSLFERIEHIPEDQIDALLRGVETSYGERHTKLAFTFFENYESGAAMIGWTQPWTPQRRLLAGSYLTMEYAIDSAALFNPSIVPHPDQSDVPAGAMRFVMSLRATGEGHVSSIVFRTGILTADEEVVMDPLPARLHRTKIAPDRTYHKQIFRGKLAEMGIARNGNGIVEEVLGSLADRFTLVDLHQSVDRVRSRDGHDSHSAEALRTILWLGQSNYHVDLSSDAQLNEFVIFPMSEEQSNGLEDLRLTRFIDDDGSIMYHGTYTAYNGVRTLPMLVHTRDFRRIEFASLNGAAAANKGMAIFPRKIKGKYVMCSRIDGENLFIAQSDSLHFWQTAEPLIRPRYPWELMQIGNCGAPIETEKGWILLTHGVGPMRTYAIGAMLLDLENPMNVIGHLKEPLIMPREEDREGYVPNVVYTCGALEHDNQLFIPFAMADKSTSFVVIETDRLLGKLLDSPVPATV